jgi:hypothetical protein
MEAVPLFFTTLALTGGLAYLLTQNYRQEIMGNWSQRRCDLSIMVMAGQFKPSDDPREPSDFANDNFTFCARTMAASLFKLILAPVFLLIGKNIDALGAIDQSTNLMRTLISTLMDGFGKIMEPFYRRFLLVGRSFANGFARLMSAMERAFGIAVAMIFMGISTTRATLNAVDFVIKIVMIIFGILIGIFILLFFVLFPLTPVILSTLAVLSAVGIGVAGAGVFCFDAETEICLEDGLTKPICKLQLGDRLLGNDCVEGILLTEREPNTTLFNYKGIVVSGSHLVWEEGAWKPVESSRLALPVQHHTQRLYSLRTSSRTMTTFCKQTGATVLFRDWEEIQQNDSITDAEWDALVQQMLSNTTIDKTPSEEHPCFSPRCLVEKNGKIAPISTLRIGDVIRDIDSKETRVLGVYIGLTHISEPLLYTKWHTDGVWWKKQNWVHHPVARENLKLTQGIHLLTESGTFWVSTEELSGGVRDFTEVGHTQLPETMNFLLKRLNEKPNP